MKYSEKEMAALINEVETSFSEYLKKSDDTKTDLNKSEEVENTETKTDTEDTLDYDESDYVEMDKLYKSMGKAEKIAHYAALKKCLFVEEEAEEDLNKSEKSEKIKENTEVEDLKKALNEENDLQKKEIVKLKEENGELRKSLEKLINTLNKSVKQPPQRKVIDKIEYINKSDLDDTDKKKIDTSKLTKSQISEKLKERIKSGDLKKSDREKINDYYYDGQISIDTIKHLL